MPGLLGQASHDGMLRVQLSLLSPTGLPAGEVVGGGGHVPHPLLLGVGGVGPLPVPPPQGLLSPG